MGDNFPEAVASFWRFLKPSIIHLAILFGLLFYLAPKTLDKCKARLSLSKNQGLIAALKSDTAEAIGLNKLAPLLTLFAVILAMVVANDVAQWLDGVLPPVILWSSPYDMLATGDTDRILRIWEHYPAVEDTGELDSVISGLYAEHVKGTGYEFWNDRLNSATSIADRVKVYAFLGFICMVIGVRLQGGRKVVGRYFFVVLPILAVCYALSIAYAVHSQKQINENKITIALKYSPRIEGPPPTVEEGGRRRVQLESEMARKDRWWHLGFPSWTW